MSKDSIVSAQVILRPGSGQPIGDGALILASNLAQFAPPPGAVASAAAAFRSRGFEVGPFVGVSFSVTGTVGAFEGFFGMPIQLGQDGGYEFMANQKAIGHELPGERLPEVLRQLVQTVAFPLPPDFGPTKFDL
jgi:hypothetical protein